MSPSWIWSDKISNERVARVGYNHFISNKGEWNNCFSKFSNRVFPPIFISTILQSVRKENLAHYFPYEVKLGLLADSRSFLANQKARNAIVGAENLLTWFVSRKGLERTPSMRKLIRNKCHQNPTVENRKAYPWLHTFWSSYAQINLTNSKMPKRNVNGLTNLWHVLQCPLFWQGK